MTQEQKVLDPDVFDTIELAALAFGGIGWAEWFTDYSRTEHTERPVCPVCVHGLALFAEDIAKNPGDSFFAAQRVSVIGGALDDVGITPFANDDAVSRINRRLGHSIVARVTFKQWARELNVVRGEVDA